MKHNIFEDDVIFGNKGENKLKSKIEKLFPIILLPYIKQYFFSVDPKEQLEGKDIVIPKIDLEIKTRRYQYRHYDDILLETKTGYKSGWFYTTKSKFITYGFFNEDETDYLENKAWILNIENCRIHFTEKRLKKFDVIKALSVGSNTWWTYNKAVPLIGFPKDCLIPFPKEYWDNNNINIKPKIKSKTTSKPKSKQNKMDSFYDLIGLV